MESTICVAAFPPKGNPINSDLITGLIQNALILDEIAKYLRAVDMISCRSANNLWKNEWTPVIQKRSTFQLCLTDKKAMLIKEMKIGLNDTSVDWDKRAQIYFDSMDSTEINARTALLFQWINGNIHNFPCSKFRIGTKAFYLVGKCVQGNFFQAISNIVTELKLENGYCLGNPYFHFENLPNLDLEFRKLKILEIGVSLVICTHRDEALRFLETIVQFAPNLHTMSFINRDGGSSDDILLNGCISAIRHPNQIKTLNINGRFRGINLLPERKFDLTELRMFLDIPKNFLSETVESFLSSQSKSLERLYLIITVYLSSQNHAISFPRLSKLEILEIECYGNVRFPELSLQKSFPKLKKLKLIGDQEQVMTVLNPVTQPVQTLEELDLRTLRANHIAISESCRIFPNMQRLKIPCSTDCLLALNAAPIDSLQDVTLWCHLEYMQDNMIKVLTGFNQDELATAEQMGILVEMEKQPLTFLQRLKILRVEEAVLTDLVCILGPMKLQSLRCLDLRIGNLNRKHQISEMMLTKMREKFTVLL